MSPPRYLPNEPLPPYAYVPGRQPHPTRDPEGHSHGRAEVPAAAPDPDRPFSSAAFLRGIDLFNLGYYWEAHEVWESLWHACGRSGPTADFLKGLIKLAAAGVKSREGNVAGVRRHAERARELFQETTRATGRTEILALHLPTLTARAQLLADGPPVDPDPRQTGKPVLGLELILSAGSD